MQFITLLLAASSALALPTTTTTENTIQKRTCFGSGENWGGDRSNAEDRARIMCRSLKNTSFTSKRSFHQCHNLSNKKKADFTILNTAETKQVIDFDTCFDGLVAEINGCDRGGATSGKIFRFT